MASQDCHPSSMLRFLILIPLFLPSCSPVSKSTLHTSKAWKAYKKESEPLPSVTLKTGERTLAYQSRTGFPPMFGGYIPSLIATDSEIVKAEFVPLDGGSDTYLTGLKPGTTKIYYANGMSLPQHVRDIPGQGGFLYSVEVIE